MSNSLYKRRVSVEAHTGFLATMAFLLVGVKTYPKQDMSSIGKMLEGLGYEPFLRDAGRDPSVQAVIAEVFKGDDADWELNIYFAAARILGIYTGVHGIVEGNAEAHEGQRHKMFKSVATINRINSGLHAAADAAMKGEAVDLSAPLSEIDELNLPDELKAILKTMATGAVKVHVIRAEDLGNQLVEEAAPTQQ